MKVSFSGVHRTGKTTTAKALAERLDIPFIQTSATAVFEEFGLKADQKMSLDERISVQYAILLAFEEEWAKHDFMVTDRSPIDMAAYLLCDITGDMEISTKNELEIEGYIRECTRVASSMNLTVMLRPGIRVVEDATKETGFMNPVYMKKLDLLIRSFFTQDAETPVYSITLNRGVTDLDKRVEVCERYILGMVSQSAVQSKSAALH
jgi:hypothetical protein